MKCPYCGSHDVHVLHETRTKGFDGLAGCCGFLFLGPWGWLCGLCGMGEQKSRTRYICKQCGRQS